MKFHFYLLIVGVTVLLSCESERIDPIEEENRITFQKRNGADPNLEQNQDRITDNVWITRGNNGGQIYNVKVSTSANKQLSPADTEWAIGTTNDIGNLTFNTFRRTIRPNQVVGKNLVIHLITDDIYLNVRFTSWSSGRRGGFAYVRDEVPTNIPNP